MQFRYKTNRTAKSKLTDKLDRIFSKYIRYKYSKDGLCECYTCGKIAPIAEMDCGHFISRRYKGTRWDENNCRPQCRYCNRFNEGRKDVFAEKLKKELNGKFEKLNYLKNGKISEQTIEDLIIFFKTELLEYL